MSNSQAILIFNPRTGRYSKQRLPALEEICAELQTAGLDVKTIDTSAPGHATSIAREAAKTGVGTVIVSGGDGTINEALQGLVGSKIRLAILPRGTANVLARELGMPVDNREVATLIARGSTRSVHLGCATDDATGSKRYFVLMAGIGLDASVVQRVRPELKRRFGKAAFWISGLSHLADWQPTPFNIEVEGKTYAATFVTIGKAAGYGGDLAVTPRAKLDRPEFEICIIESQSRLRYLHLLSYALRSGIPPHKKGVHFLQATRAHATGDAPVQVDGEVIGKLPMTFTIVPETIDIIVP